MSVESSSRRWRHALCTSLTVAGVMAAVVPAAAARSQWRKGLAQAAMARTGMTAGSTADPTAGKVLGGLTSQGWPVVMEVAKTGKRLAMVGAGLDMSCTSGYRFSIPDGWRRLPLSATGKVKVAATLPPVPGTPASLTGGTDSFSGRLDRRHATFSGVWELQLIYSLGAGQTDQCDSGRVTFLARL
jgi:hypothetical protein